MAKPKVKICGITNIIDAKNALALGADYIGFNNLKSSPRFLTLDQINEIAQDFSNDEKAKSVLLTDEPNIDEINNDCSLLGFKKVQPYGSYKINDLRALKLFEIEVFMPIRVSSEEDLKGLDNYRDFASVVILDAKSKDPEKLGGTGETFDWNLFGKAKTMTKVCLALAGGLNVDNVKDAISQTDPHMIDISSGLENKLGEKSFDKMKQLFTSLRTL